MDWLRSGSGAFRRRLVSAFPALAGKHPQLGFEIAVLSFDRPDYLTEVLESLRKQVSDDVRITLFQDGHIDPFTGKAVASPENTRACASIFRRLFPAGEIVSSPENLGIALNYERAEKRVFLKHGSEACLFLEDDLVLSPRFVEVTGQLLRFAKMDPRIAYVSACGNLWADNEQQRLHSRELIPMHENWGAAMTRISWLAEREFRQSYLELIGGHSYKNRDHEKITSFYASRGWICKFTSQDSARWIACLERNAIRLSTFACHARYIGEQGVHFTPEIYEKGGFAKTVMYEGSLPELTPPDDEWIENCLSAERDRFSGKGNGFYVSHGS